MPRYGSGDDVPTTLEEFGESIKADLRQEYQQNENQRKFWIDFYQAYPTLRANAHIVLAVWNENVNQLMGMTPAAGAEMIATAAQERVDYLERTKIQRAEAAAYSGGPGFEGTPTMDQPVAQMPSTLGDSIKARRTARHGGAFRPDAPTDAPTYGRRRSA